MTAFAIVVLSFSEPGCRRNGQRDGLFSCGACCGSEGGLVGAAPAGPGVVLLGRLTAALPALVAAPGAALAAATLRLTAAGLAGTGLTASGLAALSRAGGPRVVPAAAALAAVAAASAAALDARDL